MHRAIAAVVFIPRIPAPEEGIIMDPRRPVVDDPVATTGLSRRSALLKMSAGGLAAAPFLPAALAMPSPRTRLRWPRRERRGHDRDAPGHHHR